MIDMQSGRDREDEAVAMQKRFRVEHNDLFPKGAYAKPGESGAAVEPVSDFDRPKREDGSRPQALDKETGLPLWQMVVLDADEQAGKRDTALTIKFAAKVRPVLPENTTPFPWTPVEFVGLTALPYIEESGNFHRIAWSFRAEGMVAPGEGKTGSSGGSGAGKAVA